MSDIGRLLRPFDFHRIEAGHDERAKAKNRADIERSRQKDNELRSLLRPNHGSAETEMDSFAAIYTSGRRYPSVA